MPSFPLRQHRYYPGFGDGRDTRRRVAGAHADALVLSPRALEILSIVSGMHLTSVQRRSLLPTLQDLLTYTGFAPLGAGPLSQADVLGACLGLAVFAIDHPSQSWSFMHVPSSRVKSPDIYALSTEGDSWHLELKSVAPLDAEVRPGRELDTCARIAAQRRRAVEQLEQATTPRHQGPAIRVVQGPRARMTIPTQGRAFVISVLPGAGLSGRTDIVSPEISGCPRNNIGQYQPCAAHCLDGSFIAGFATTLVVLTGERQQASVDPAPVPTPTLGSLRIINGALWSGSAQLAEFGLQSLANALRETRSGAGEHQASLVLGCLRATRSLTSVAMRKALVNAIPESSVEDWEAIDREAGRAGESVPSAEPVSLSELIKYSDGPAIPSRQIVVSIDNTEFFGVQGSRGAHLSPVVSEPGAVRAGEGPFESVVQAFRGIAEPLLEEAELIERAPNVAPLRDRRAGRLQVGVSFDSAKTSAWLSTNGDIEIRHTPGS
jgi:hypothetical protein